MTTQNLALFEALGAKMDFLGQRQRIIAQNIANSDTPNYRPKDLAPVDFGQVLDRVTGSRSASVHLQSTNEAHMPAAGEIADPKSRTQKGSYEVAPAGNAVIMEEQLIKSGRTVMDYNLMSSLYQKNLGLIRTALGRQG